MSRQLKQVAVAFVVVFVAAQLVRPERANPATDPTRTIAARVGAGNALVPILDRACGDCHSNHTAWPWYTNVAPLSWLMVYGVREGRAAVNFSEWAAYPPERQRQLLDASCHDATTGKMPDHLWTTLHPEARLSTQDIDTICAAAHP